MPATETAPNIFPALFYRDAKNAIDWLCRAFGFEQLAVYEGPNGSVAHAELRLGPGVVMLGSAKENHFGLAPPTDGKVTQVTNIVVEDPDAHCARAQTEGAEIVVPLADMEYGSREYTARDPEGHVWSFGTYRPKLEAGV
jgi:uncharacterized glyoxalase superfamily protein PhnB